MQGQIFFYFSVMHTQLKSFGIINLAQEVTDRVGNTPAAMCKVGTFTAAEISNMKGKELTVYLKPLEFPNYVSIKLKKIIREYFH